MLLRINAILLTLVMLLNMNSIYIAFHAYKKYLKHENKNLIFNKIPHSQMEILAIPNHELKQKDLFKRIKTWEIQYKGIMFDFVRENTIDDTTYFYGFTDNKEMRLNKIYQFVSENDFSKNKDDANNILIQIVKNVSVFFFKDNISMENCQFLGTKPRIFYLNFYQSLAISVIPHPPNHLSSLFVF